MAFKKWVVGQPDREKAKKIAEECEIDPFAALISCVRGVSDSSELELLLSNEPLLCDPYELADVKIAAERIKTAIESREKIAIFGDYDCDGVVSTAILYDYLKSLSADVVPYIPDRLSEGYGMNTDAIDRLKSQGVSLIITVDNGISCFDEITYAKSLGIETVVTDHHIPSEKLPEAVAVVDPHRADCPSSFKEICGAEVIFKVICVIADAEPEQMLPQFADLLAVATIADVMPLVNENRSIVKAGINVIKRSTKTGIAALLSVSGMEKASLNASRASFGIIPRINAAGRMGDAMRAFRLLTETDMLAALNIANEIDAENSERQNIERKITEQAYDLIEKNGYKYDRIIVVSGENWHSGIVGIVASRIVDRYGKPAIVLSEEGDNAHGSGRSIAGFHLYNALENNAGLLLKFGGHELAAGMSIETAKIDDFRRAVNDYANKLPQIIPELRLDFRLNPSALSVDMAYAIKTLEPFGTGNPVPMFGIFGVKLERINPIGAGKHLKLFFSKNGAFFQALLFGTSEEQFCFEIGDVLDIAVILDVNNYHGESSLSVQIKAIRKSGTDDDAVFEQVAAFDAFMSNSEADVTLLLPERSQAGVIYKYICKEPVSAEKIKYRFINDIGYAKTQVALKTFCELGLVEENEGKYSAVNTATRTDLANSPTYKKLLETSKTR